MSRAFCVLVVVSCLSAAGCSSSGEVSASAVAGGSGDPDAGVTIQVGDSVRVAVYGHEDLSGEFEVEPGGFVSMPLIGRVLAAGSTVAELESRVRDELSPDYLVDPSVSVDILNQNPIYILGEVRQPGRYEHTPDLTVYAAVALAGGYTYRAKTDVAFIIRFNDPSRRKQKVTPDAMMMPGDVIEIPERLF